MLVVCSYLLPLLVGLGVTSDPSAWEDGYLAVVGLQVGGSRRGRAGGRGCSWRAAQGGLAQGGRAPALAVLITKSHPSGAGRRQVAGLVDCGGLRHQPDRPI